MLKSIFLSCLILCLTTHISATHAKPGKKIKVKAEIIENFLPSEPSLKTFGKLEYMGGLVLNSDNKDFGGISGIRLLNENQFIAITDKGEWLKAEIERDKGKLENITNARMARLRDVKGNKLKGKKQADAEGIELEANGFIISFERNHRAERFSFNGDHLKAKEKKPIFKLNDVGLSSNKGPEGIARAPTTSPLAGSLLAFPENAFNDDGNLIAYIFSENAREELGIKPSGGFSLTDADFLPNGDLFVLERRYSIFSGLGMRIRLFKSDTVQAASLLEGETIIEATGQYQIDNMEGLTVSQLPDGSTRIILISDDNFSKDQRTVLLEFRLPN